MTYIDNEGSQSFVRAANESTLPVPIAVSSPEFSQAICDSGDETAQRYRYQWNHTAPSAVCCFMKHKIL
jgi:hypothetical protein